MSQRTYTGPVSRGGPGSVSTTLVWLLAVATIGLQIAFPLADETARADLAAVTVVVFFAASVAHAWAYRGVAWALAMVVATAGVGLAAEAVGLRTGWPFGDYTYSEVLGPQVLDVPVVVPLAWTMMAYPVFAVARAVVRSRWIVALAVGWTLMAWDVFLDPMMVELGGWTWQADGLELPGVPGIPAVNFLGWLAVGLVMGLLLSWLPVREVPVGQPAVLLGWVYFSSTLGAAAFFERGSVALVGGIAMGISVLPLLWRLWEERG